MLLLWEKPRWLAIPMLLGFLLVDSLYFMGPWHLVRDDVQSGVLAAPLGFVEDGSRYCLFSPAALKQGSLEKDLLKWLQTVE